MINLMKLPVWNLFSIGYSLTWVTRLGRRACHGLLWVHGTNFVQGDPSFFRWSGCLRHSSLSRIRSLKRGPNVEGRSTSSRHNRRGGPISHWASAQLRVRRHLEACRKERWWFHGPSRCSVHLGALFSPVKKPFSTVRRGEYVTDAHKV